jgi:RimJ/RimL family protein N-acetyltransferase
METLRIEGQRIVLRDWQLDDLDVYRAWMQPSQRWQEFDGPYYPPLSPAKIDSRIDELRHTIHASDWSTPRRSLVIADRTTDILLGTVSWYWIGEETNWLAIGISLYDPSTWGQGLGYAALGLWCEYLWASKSEIIRLDLRTWQPGYDAAGRKARISTGGALSQGSHRARGILRWSRVRCTTRGVAGALSGRILGID